MMGRGYRLGLERESLSECGGDLVVVEAEGLSAGEEVFGHAAE